MSRPAITVVICTYNRARVLPCAIRSVLEQRGTDLELVVVDDGSTDATRDVVLGVDDPRLRYVHRENGGLSVARNTGVRSSRGDWLVFLDDDDELLPGCLARAVDCAARDHAALVTWAAEVVAPDGKVTVVEPEDLGAAFCGYRALFRAGTFAVDRVLFDEIGGFDEEQRTSHQTELGLRLMPACRERGLEVVALDDPLTRIHQRVAVARGRNEPERLLEATNRILERHREQLARSPQLLADYLGVAGVAAARLGRWAEARADFAAAATIEPRRAAAWKHRVRSAIAASPPFARRVWRELEAAAPDDGAMPRPLVLYRGPWQGRRVRFLLDAFYERYGELDFVWVNPGFQRDGDRSWAASLRTERPYVRVADELDGAVRAMPRTVARLLRGNRGRRTVCAIGFTAIVFARVLRPDRLVWAVNGIPEERLLYTSGWRSRLAVELAWLTARVGRRPDAVIVVSEPMGRHVSRRMGGHVQWAKAPTSVDVEVFDRPAAPDRTVLTYVGSGAPWQGIDLLAGIWAEVARQDPTARFRVVSRDERAAALLAGVPDGQGEMVAARGADQVAAQLIDTALAFLVRRPDVVNETSFPTKFGEYLAAGVPVVTTDIGWEVSDIVRRSRCGLLVDPADPPAKVAAEILDFQRAVLGDPTIDDRCRSAGRALSRDAWLERLVARLEEIA